MQVLLDLRETNCQRLSGSCFHRDERNECGEKSNRREETPRGKNKIKKSHLLQIAQTSRQLVLVQHPRLGARALDACRAGAADVAVGLQGERDCLLPVGVRCGVRLRVGGVRLRGGEDGGVSKERSEDE